MKKLLAIAALVVGLAGCGSHAPNEVTSSVGPVVKKQNFAWGEYTVCCDRCYDNIGMTDADRCWGGTLPCPDTCPGTCAD